MSRLVLNCDVLAVLLLRLQAPRSRLGRVYSQVRKGREGESPFQGLIRNASDILLLLLGTAPSPAVSSRRTQPLHFYPSPVLHVLHAAAPSGGYTLLLTLSRGPLSLPNLAGPATPIKGLYCCGDSTFPGIGLPAVAASGAICANTLVSVGQHIEMLKGLGL